MGSSICGHLDGLRWRRRISDAESNCNTGADAESDADPNANADSDANSNSSDCLAEWRRKRKHFTQHTANREFRFYSELHGDG